MMMDMESFQIDNDRSMDKNDNKFSSSSFVQCVVREKKREVR